jgi:Protein of unknown function (DUF3501)
VTARRPDALTVGDILDLRGYERVRDEYRRQVMARKRRRRVALGPIMTVLFESVDTVRFQVQEMARAERILTDTGIEAELEVYNRLLPAAGELSGTLFIELTTDEELRHWLPRLVGVERSLGLELDALGDGRSLVAGMPEATHADALTREEVTAAVHYLRFPFSEAEISRFAAGQVTLVADHPHYAARSALQPDTRHDLLADLEGRSEPLIPGELGG